MVNRLILEKLDREFVLAKRVQKYEKRSLNNSLDLSAFFVSEFVSEFC